MAKLTSESAVRPPKRLVSPSTVRIVPAPGARASGATAAAASAIVLGHGELAFAHRRGHEACGTEQHHHDHGEAEEQHADHLGVDDRAPEDRALHRLDRVA